MRDEPDIEDTATLDPEDWREFRAVARLAMDDAVKRVQNLRDEPVWRPMPDEIRASFSGPVPTKPTPLEEVYQDVAGRVIPFAMGNVHPRFWAWYMGAGDLTGALADFLAGVDGSNLGGGDTAASLVDQQVTDWIRQMIGFPDGASGALVSGGSMANIIGLTAARNAKAGVDLHREGLAAMERPLVFYASDQVHSCHDKAMNLLGLGTNALRRIPTDAQLRMDVEALAAAIDADRAAGRLHAPFDVGCILIRDRSIHRATFAENAEYLQRATRGLAAAEFLHD